MAHYDMGPRDKHHDCMMAWSIIAWDDMTYIIQHDGVVQHDIHYDSMVYQKIYVHIYILIYMYIYINTHITIQSYIAGGGGGY